MPQGEQIQRQWNLLRALQTRGEGIPLAQLAQDFEVSPRTIQRDLELLQELGFPSSMRTTCTASASGGCRTTSSRPAA